MATAEVDLGDPIPRNIRTPTMSIGTFPSSHTTLTATPEQSTACHFDPTYLRTVPGIVKILQITFNFVGFFCILASRSSGRSQAFFFCFISAIGFGISKCLLLVHCFHVPERLPQIPWLMMELICCFVLTILYLIAACLVAAYAKYNAALGIAAFFGFAAQIAYGYNAYINICEMYLNKVARNQPNAENQSSSATSTATKMFT